MTTDAWTKFLTAVCHGCGQYRGCDLHRQVSICEACWRNRDSIAAKAKP